MGVKIEERTQGEVTILRIEGRLTLGEGDLALREAVAQALEANRRKILLDLAEVPYLDSAGLGELVSTFTRVSRAGGRLSLCHATKRLTDLLTITKLLTVFEVFESIDQGVRAMGGGELRTLSFQCPVHGCGSWVKLPPRSAGATEVSCPQCGAVLALELPSELPAETQGMAAVTRVTLPSYEGEQVTLEDGRPTVLSIHGRLDLFAAEVLERAWRTVLLPRRVVIDLSEATELSEAGLAALAALGRTTAEDSRCAIALGKSPERERWRQALHSVGPVFDDVAEGARSLGVPPSGPGRLEAPLRATAAG